MFGLLGAFHALSVHLSWMPGDGFPPSAYESLKVAVQNKLGEAATTNEGAELCIGHSADGARSALRAAAQGGDRCRAGVVTLASAPLPDDFDGVTFPVLVIAGELDGVVPLARFAVARYRSRDVPSRRFVLVRGASHASFASSSVRVALDLHAETKDEDVHATVAELVRGFLEGNSEGLQAAEEATNRIASPLVDALKLEGSEALGVPACNSDFPTNPTCNYPKWPDHSLPFGPAPAPSPLPPKDCVCGSPWVETFAAPMLSGLPSSTSIVLKDAFHDVSDTHPFHLPHIFNSCASSDAKCVLNATTVTMPIVKPGDLWPAGKASAPLSALELRTKLKSREAVWTSAGLPKASSALDHGVTLCKDINQAALVWALGHAEAEVKSRYVKSGEPMVVVEDREATIGITGPEWIKDELKFRRVSEKTSPTGTRVEVMSWKFVVGNVNKGNVPWFFPVGMHYCKFLSPARAMEWIYTDSIRNQSPFD
eukprot:TRINITY_DN20844_c0_g1_i3.p1 TRINITY_DN20844_c0_g1~~TRINITY_DN20844_c0_g1_i3.p1  ORF type:complete len:483 (-),score=77.06 TRINITY_DN20844_c0_g1_i3:89-1537(-)